MSLPSYSGSIREWTREAARQLNPILQQGDEVSLAAFGATMDGSANDAGPLVEALSTGKVVKAGRGFVATLDAAQSATVMKNLDNLRPLEPSTITLADEEIAMGSDYVDLTNPDLINLTVKGPSHSTTSASGVSVVSSAAKNHSITFTVASTTNFTVGGYALVTSVAGTGGYGWVAGCHEVTAIGSGTITVKSVYAPATAPTYTFTSATVRPINCVLAWTSGRGLAIEHTTLRSLARLVLAGPWDATTGTPSDGPDDGLLIGSQANTTVTGSSESNQINTGGVWCQAIGVVGWPNNGIQALGGKAYFVVSGASGNGHRGIQSATGSSIIAKSFVSTGNGSSGADAEQNAVLNMNDGIVAGNQEQGLYALAAGHLNFTNGHAVGNGNAGADARNNGSINADGAEIVQNPGGGVSCTMGRVLLGNSATVSGNTTQDILLREGGFVNASGASSIGTIDDDPDSGTVLIEPGGSIRYGTTAGLRNSGGDEWEVSISGVGDRTYSYNGTAKITYKSSGIIYPNSASATLGRSADVWSKVYATDYYSGANKVVGAQQAAIADDASGAANEAKVNAILAALRAHGLIAT